jgi:hypothetical protein
MHAGALAGPDLGAEARDPLTASDIVLQLLAYIPPAAAAAGGAADGSGGTSGARTSGGGARASSGGRTSSGGAGSGREAGPESIVATLQFFSFPASRTAKAQLVPAGGIAATTTSTGHAEEQEQRLLLLQVPGASSTGSTGSSTSSMAARFLVDGSQAASSAEPGAADNAAFDQHLQLCRYLASRRLQLELWDGASQLPLGSAQLELQVWDKPMASQACSWAATLALPRGCWGDRRPAC